MAASESDMSKYMLLFTYGSLYDDVVMASIMPTSQWPCQLRGYMSFNTVGSLLLLTRRSVRAVLYVGALLRCRAVLRCSWFGIPTRLLTRWSVISL